MKTMDGGATKEITYDTFLDMVEDGKVESVVVTSDRIEITPKKEEKETNVSSPSNPFFIK